MKIRDYLEMLGLHEGMSVRTKCPKCGGKDFSVAMVDGSILYNCYKASCNITGAHHVGLTAADIQKKLMRMERDTLPPTKHTMVIPEYFQPVQLSQQALSILTTYGLSVQDKMYDIKGDRLVFLIKHKGRIIDAAGRKLGRKDGPKWFRYTGAADYFYNGAAKKVVVVEDCISACVVARQFPNAVGFALLGTSLTAAHKAALMEYDSIYFALDPDATSKNIQYTKDMRMWSGLPVKAVQLEDDLKYQRPADMQNMKELLG